MTYYNKLFQSQAELTSICNTLSNDPDEAAGGFLRMRNAALRFSNLLGKYLEDPYSLTEEDRKNWENAFTEMKEQTDIYASNHGINFSEKGRRRGEVSNRLNKLCQNMEKWALSAGKAIGDANSFEKSLNQGNEDANISHLYDYLNSHETRMQPADCFSAVPIDFSSDDQFGHMLWLAQREEALVGGGYDDDAHNNIYRKAWKDMKNAINNASMEDQMRLARKIERYRTALIDNLASKLSQYENDGHPEQIYAEQDYRKLEILYLLSEPLGEDVKKFMEHGRNSEAYNRKASVIAMNPYLPEHATIPFNISDERLHMDQEMLETSSYTSVPEEIRPLFDCYETMMRDQRHASPYFDAMRTSLEHFLAQDHVHIKDSTAYEALLSVAVQTANTYCNKHRGRASDQAQWGRVENARNVRERLSQKLNSLHASMEEERREYEQEAHRVNNSPEHKEIVRLGRLNNVASAQIVPKTPRRDLSQSRVSSFFNGAFHGIATGIRALSSVVTWPVYGLSRLWNGKKEAVTEAHEYDRIPGLDTREKFKPFDPDKGSADQPVISDPRRAPLMWEREIAGDPNQPPTISIYAKQSEENSARANTHIQVKGGHAFLSMEYTKTNPITGKPGRYKVTFGYAANPLKNSRISESALQLENGYFTQGYLYNNENHRSNAGITYQVDNRQINKVIMAAQDYAKGGYNIVTRNCTDFVKDMADAAGLDTKGLFEKTDFEAGAVGTTAIGAALPFTDFFRIRAESALENNYNSMSENDVQLIGQQKVTKEDFTRLRHTDFNLRMKGYNPSRLAEAIKGSGNYNLTSNSFEPGKNAVPETKEDLQNYYRTQYGIESNKLRNEIERFCVRNHLDSDKIKSLFNWTLNDYNAIGDLLPDGFAQAPQNGQKLGDFLHEKKTKLQEASETMRKLQHSLEDFYKNILHGAPELYTPFQHMNSFYSYLENHAEKHLAELDYFAAGKITGEEDPKLDLHGEIDQTREDAESLYGYRFYKLDADAAFEYVDYPRLAAAAMVYPEDKNYANEYFKKIGLDHKAKNQWTSDEKKEYEEIKPRVDMVENMKHSMSYYVQAESFTKGDIDFLFGKLAKCSETFRAENLSEVFQGFAWKHALRPTQAQVNEAMQTFVLEKSQDFKNLLLENADNKALKNLTSGLAVQLTETLTGAMQGDNPELKQIMNSVIQNKMRSQEFTGEPDKLADFKKSVYNSSTEAISKSLMFSRIQPQIDKVQKDMLQQLQAGLPEGRKLTAGQKKKVTDIFKQVKENVENNLQYCLKKAISREDASYELGNPPKDAENLEASVNNLAAAAKHMTDAPGFLSICDKVNERFSHYDRALAGNDPQERDARPEIKGLNKLVTEGRKAAKFLADQATIGRESLNNVEKKELVQQIARLTFVSFAQKLSTNDQKKLFKKLSADPKAYDRYIARLAKTEEFKDILKQGNRALNPNSLCTKEGMEELMTRCDNVFRKGFYKKVHINKAKMEERADRQINIIQPE